MAAKDIMMVAGIPTLTALIAALLVAVSVTADFAHSLDTPALF